MFPPFPRWDFWSDQHVPFFFPVKAQVFAPSHSAVRRRERSCNSPSQRPEPMTTAWPELARRRRGQSSAAASGTRRRQSRQASLSCCDAGGRDMAAGPTSSHTPSVPAMFVVRSTRASGLARDTPWPPRAMWRQLRSPYGLPPLPPHRSPCRPPPPCSGGYDVPALFRLAALRPNRQTHTAPHNPITG